MSQVLASAVPTDSAASVVARIEGAGRVFLVGAGPGDPQLLTLRAAKLLGVADAVVYDHLVSAGVLDMVNPAAERIYVGKQESRHTLAQEEINLLLVRLASQGRQVVRLKGGDPFIFGRGAEEAEVLVRHGVPFEVVPGITAAGGVSCYAGIPLTHRDYAQSCKFITGHLKDGTLNWDWANLVQPRQTVVIYMGLGALPEISRQLMAHGQARDMPIAVIERGTTPRQRVVVGSLATISELVREQAFESPCLIIIGQVVGLRNTLDWYGCAAQP